MRVMPHLIIVTWSNHLAANAGDGSAGKRAVSNTAKTLCIHFKQCIFIFIVKYNQRVVSNTAKTFRTLCIHFKQYIFISLS